MKPDREERAGLPPAAPKISRSGTGGASEPGTELRDSRFEPEGENPTARFDSSLDRVIRWCVIVFLGSTLVLGGIAWYAIKTGHVAAYLNAAGLIYVALSTVFLSIIAIAFIQGHLGSSKEIEAPKLELFDIEQRK